jgi:type II secretory pathway component PulF
LFHALKATPGVAAPETILAAMVGQDTGRLALCLRKAGQNRVAAVWVEVVPRIVYPLLLTLCLIAVLCFWAVFLVPKMRRIFADFQVQLPERTQFLMEISNQTTIILIVVGQLVFLGLVLVALLYLSSRLRWYLPLFASFYRRYARGRVLKMLAVFLDVGKPVPESLGVLASSGTFGPEVCRRLETATGRVQQGESLADSLHSAGLLPGSMTALVKTGERARNLPWVLAECGDTLAMRAVRLVQDFTAMMFPIFILLLGLLIGYVVVGMYLPLFEIISRLSE